MENKSWASIKECGNPKDEFRRLVMLSNGWQQVAYYDGDEWLLVCNEYCPIENELIKVVAYMDLPKSYKEE